MKPSLLILALAAALGGCSTLTPMELDPAKGTNPETAAKIAKTSEAWNEPAVLSEGRSAVVLLTPQSLPESIKNRRVSMELDPGATVQDMVAVLGKLGITVIISDAEAGKKDFYLPRFNGTVGGLLSAITRVTDVWFTWHDGTIVVSSQEKVGVSVPQEANFGTELGKGLDSLGVKDKAVHWQSGMAVINLSPSQFRKVKTFLERYTANAAVVTMQVAVVNVTLNQTAKQGIDWDKLQISALKGGTLSQLNNRISALNPSTGAGAGTGTNTGTNTGSGTTTGGTTSGGTTPGAVVDALLTGTGGMGAAGWAGGALTGAIFTDRFSFQGLFNFLQNYGTAETKQNVMLKTVAGNKVEFKSLTQIPYVSEIGVTTTAATTGTNNGTALGSSKTEKADDGITVEMTPTFDAAANSVTIDLKLSIKAVVAFNELSAGNQLGKLTQPTTAERSFTDTLRLRPGQTVVVGGLTYDSVSDNRGAPIFLAGTKFESQSLTVNRQSMFIVVRPTVMKLGQVMAQEAGESLEMMPAGQFTPESQDPVKAKTKAAKTAAPGKAAKADKAEKAAGDETPAVEEEEAKQ